MAPEQYLEKIMNDYGDALFRMCYLYLKDYHLAEDAVQDTFIKAIKAYDSLKDITIEKTWLTRIAINTCKNIMRTRWFQTYRLGLGNEKDDCEVTENPYSMLIEKNSVSNAMLELRLQDREILILYYYQELTIKEISLILGKKENATLQQLRRARNRLKKILEEVGYEVG